MPRKRARPKDVRTALEEMSDKYLECYTNAHNWVLFKQTEIGRKGWERGWFCPRCKMNKIQITNRRGYKLTPKYDRPTDYGLRGLGLVQGSARSVAVLEDIRRTMEKDLPEVTWASERV